MSRSGNTVVWFAIVLFLFAASFAKDDADCTKSEIKALGGKVEVSWKSAKVKGTQKIIFTITVHGMLDRNSGIQGWVALGFMRGPPKRSDMAADYAVVFLENKHHVKLQDCNTITNKQKLQYDKQSQDYENIDKFTQITRKNNQVVFGVARKVDTKDKEDVHLEAGPLWLIASYGADNVHSCKDLPLSSILDNKEVTHVCILPPTANSSVSSSHSNGTENTEASWTHKAGQLAKQHWIGVIIGVAGAVTLVAVVVVYCMCRGSSDGYKKKKVTMSFYKERNDEDDEARVSMLSAQMT